MKLEDMPKALAKVYLANNEITGAFIWKEDEKWIVYIGDPENASGWKEAEFKYKKEAKEYCDKLNALIEELNKGYVCSHHYG